MIVRRPGDTLQLITQPDHARLAGAIMQHSVALTTHPRRASILLAVAEHDDGWTEEDAAPRIDRTTGVPLDFISSPIAVRQAVWPRGVTRLTHDPWAAALVAQHAIVIFERFRGDSTWARFFAEMEAMRQTMLDASTRPIDELLADYRFVGLGDTISLTFCNGWTDVQQADEWSVHLSGSYLVVSPDPFGGASIPIAIDAREIRWRAFRTDAELRAELGDARVTTLEGLVVGRALPA